MCADAYSEVGVGTVVSFLVSPTADAKIKL
jgi:hypothetical protein